MTNSLGIEVGAGPIERARADIVVISFFEDERPLSGAAGRADWRLCGKLSELIAEGTLTGAAGEAVLVTPRGGFRAPILVALGLGRRHDFGADALEAAARDAASRSLALHASNLVLPLPGSEPSGVPLRERVDAVVRGVTAGVREHSADLHIQLVTQAREVVPATEALRANQQPRVASDVILHVYDGPRPESERSARRPGRAGTRDRAPLSPSTPPQVIK